MFHVEHLIPVQAYSSKHWRTRYMVRFLKQNTGSLDETEDEAV